MPYRSQPLYKQIKKYIVDKINSGELAINDKIPSEKELSELYSVSRITVVNAITQLKNEGIVFRVPGKGTFVSPAKPDNNISFDTIQRSQSNLIGLILCHLGSPFHINLLSSIEKSITDAGYVTLFGKSNSSLEAEVNIINKMLEANISGLIIYPTDGCFYNKRLVQMSLDRFPFIMIDRTLPGINAFSVTSNNYDISYDVASKFVKRNHKSFAIFEFISDASSISDRIRGFQDALIYGGIKPEKIHKISLNTCWISDNNPLFNTDLKTVKNFLSNNKDVTAVFAINSGLSLTVYKAAIELNIQVPEELEIITFDNPNSFHTINNQAIHYIDQNEKTQIGPKSVELLIKQINNIDISNFVGECTFREYKPQK